MSLDHPDSKRGPSSEPIIFLCQRPCLSKNGSRGYGDLFSKSIKKETSMKPVMDVIEKQSLI